MDRRWVTDRLPQRSRPLRGRGPRTGERGRRGLPARAAHTAPSRLLAPHTDDAAGAPSSDPPGRWLPGRRRGTGSGCGAPTCRRGVGHGARHRTGRARGRHAGIPGRPRLRLRGGAQGGGVGGDGALGPRRRRRVEPLRGPGRPGTRGHGVAPADATGRGDLLRLHQARPPTARLRRGHHPPRDVARRERRGHARRARLFADGSARLREARLQDSSRTGSWSGSRSASPRSCSPPQLPNPSNAAATSSVGTTWPPANST